jgi:sigma-B regulation protein RsbU (phosphoserine phosphatase)
MARIEPDGRLRAVNAGHLPLLIRRRNGAIDEVNSSGLPLGILEIDNYRDEDAVLEPGDLLLLFTDGLTEAEDDDDEEFGVERLKEVVAGLDGASAEEACDAILTEVGRHLGEGSMQDDATLLVVERLREAH